MPSVVNSKDIEDLINNLKSGISLWEDLIVKSSKFSNSIKGMTVACSDLLDSMHTVCDIASKSNCGLRNTGISLTKLVLREKKVEMKVCCISTAVNENLVGELDKYVNEWRRSSTTMKKERDHEWRRANAEYQKSLSEVERTEKKLRKKNAGKVGLSETASLQIEYANQDAQNKRRYVEELERCALRRAAVEERQRFKQFLALLKPILDCQLSMREDLDNLEEVVSQLYGEKSENLDVLPEELEQYIQEHMIEGDKRSSIPRSYSTLSKQQSTVSNGSRSSLNSNSMSTTSSEWNNNNVLINACMEMSSRLNENVSNISQDSGIKSDKTLMESYEMSTTQEFEWNKTPTQGPNADQTSSLKTTNESESEESSTEDENDASTDHNSQDGIIDNNNDLFLLPKRHSNEEPQFELPPDYPDSLPPPPPPSNQMNNQNLVNTSQSAYGHSFNNQRDALYPNQSIPPPVYSNLQELKINAAKKFGANTLSRQTYKERGQLDDVFADDKEKMKNEDTNAWSRTDMKDSEAVSISPPALYCNSKEETNFGCATFADLDTTQNNPSRILMKGDLAAKSSMIRRASFATEMQVPQTPKTANTIRRPSVQEKAPVNVYSNKNRGRSMSVTRESNYEPDDQEETSEDFNTIRQRIVSRINSELRPPTLPKPEVQMKISPNAVYMPYDYSNNLSSPVTVRSNRFFNERVNKHCQQSLIANQNPQMNIYQQSRVTGAQHHDLESAAGEEPASNDYDMSGMGAHHMTVGRKGDPFKQQLMHVLHAPKGPDSARPLAPNHSQQTPAMSSFHNPGTPASNLVQRVSSAYGKPKPKSSIPNSKYIY